MQKDLIEVPEKLPDIIDELIDLEIVTNSAVQSFKAKLNACKKSEIANEYIEITLRDGRRVSRLNIDANAKLGKLLKERGVTYIKGDGGSFKGTSALPEGINKKQSHQALEIDRHPKIVDEIWKTKLNDIPTKYDVLKRIREIKKEAKNQQQKNEILEGLKKPKGNYDIIVIDPPWPYGRKYDADGGRVASPYPEMSIESIESIELPTKDNCVLWLWTTDQFIWDAKELLECWNFEYKAILVWDKDKMGIGSWLRLQCEFCLLGIKGKPLWENKGIRDIIREARTEHSVKPEAFYKMIDDNFTGRKLDYFGRKKRKGWDIYGAGQKTGI